MRFRLFYEGALYSSQGDPMAGQNDRRGDHKHAIRMAFHQQLKHLWDQNEPLRDQPFKDKPRYVDYLAGAYTQCGTNWVPFINPEQFLLCKLDLLILRRDKPGGIFETRDLDNRLKTVFDALRIPKSKSELGTNSAPLNNGPYYTLLSDDSLISGVTIETDELLDPPDIAGRDDSFVRLLIQVSVRFSRITTDNLAYGG